MLTISTRRLVGNLSRIRDAHYLHPPGVYLNITSRPSLQRSTKTCGRCSLDMADFEYSWYTELLTYTAATVVIAVDNSTTVTKSSTIQAARFVIPESLGYAVSTVRDSLVTRVLGGIAYTL